MLPILLMIEGATAPKKVAPLPVKEKAVPEATKATDPEYSEDASTPEAAQDSLLGQKEFKSFSVATGDKLVDKDSPVEVKVKLSARSSIFGAFARQKNPGANNEKDTIRPHFGIADTKVTLEGIVDNQQSVYGGYTIRINALPNKFEADRNFVWVHFKRFGRFLLGNNKPLYHDYWKYAQALVGGFNGWDGSFPDLYNDLDGTFDGVDLVPYSNTATQLSYVTEKLFGGLTLGVGYAPSVTHRGSVKYNSWTPEKEEGAKLGGNPTGWADKKGPAAKDNVNLLARYDFDYGDFRYGLGLTYIWDHASVRVGEEKIKVRNGSAYGVSGQFGYKNTTLGVEYIDAGKSHLPKDNAFFDTHTTGTADATPLYKFEDADKGHAGRSITAFLAHKVTDRWTVGAGYQWTKRKINADRKVTRNSFIATSDFQILPGLYWLAELDYIISRDNTIDKDKRNNGFIALTGIKVKI